MPRPRKPNHLKILVGDREDRINRNEPIPSDEPTITPSMPLPESAQKVWDRVASDLIDKGLLTAWDVDVFVLFCDSAGMYFDCRALLADAFAVAGSAKGTTVKSPFLRIMRDCAEVMLRVGGRFGLTPADRAGIDLSSLSDGDDSAADRFFSR